MNLSEQVTQLQTPSYRTIKLSQGQVALVDTGDYEWLSQWTWHAHWNEYTQSFYAGRNEYLGNYQQIYTSMHREILGLKFGDKREGDHVNHNTLDNRRSNLRIATRAQNQQNGRKYKNNKSGFKGVTFHRHIRKWQAYTQVNKKRFHLGYYETPEAAYAVYCEAVKRLHGEFAHLG